MKDRMTLVYLVVAVFLGGLYLFDLHQAEKKKEEEKAAKALVEVTKEQLLAVTLVRGRQKIELKRMDPPDGPGWVITAPVQSRTQPSAVERLVENLANLRSLRVIEKKSEDLSQFGFDQPSFLLHYRSDTVSGVLYFGDPSPIDHGYYARKNEEKKVYLVSEWDKDALDKDLFDLRDKRLFTLPPDEIRRMTFEGREEKWIINKENGRWIFSDNPQQNLDDEKVDLLVRRFAWAEASSFEENGVHDLGSLGLDPARARVVLSTGEKSEEILLGDPPPQEKDTDIYVKMTQKDQVMTAKKWLLHDLPGKREDLEAQEHAPKKGADPDGE